MVVVIGKAEAGQRQGGGQSGDGNEESDKKWREDLAVAVGEQVRYRKGSTDVRAMVVGYESLRPGMPGAPGHLVAGRQPTRSHYEAVADVRTAMAKKLQPERMVTVVVGGKP